ncbi:M23 family metallopeptidase [Kribbella deserti]|uniref:M23 family metallopeptidase n=1 Tax=Kribbella deserti TaxID=1926257 RepID=A0ABV6QMA7_9ACTN
MKRLFALASTTAALAAVGLTAHAAPTPESRIGEPAPGSYMAQRAAIPAAQVAAARAAADRDTRLLERPILRVPFRCHETWSGASRSGHSPSYYSLDFNWGSGSDDLGKPVKTSAAGTVIISSYDAGGYGNYIRIAHGDGWHTLYAHLQSRGVAAGARVSDNQQIGRVGSTGNSSGPHLHYEQIKDGVVVAAKFGQSNWATYPGPANYTRIADC